MSALVKILYVCVFSLTCTSYFYNDKNANAKTVEEIVELGKIMCGKI